MASNTMRTAHHLTCISAAGGLLYLAYSYVTTHDGLHPAIAGMLIGCLVVLAMCYPDDASTDAHTYLCEECEEVIVPAGQTRCAFCDEGEGRVI